MGRYCEVVDPASPDHQPGMAALLRGEPHPALAGSTPAAQAPTPGLAAVIRITLAVSRCAVRQTDGCGCGGKALCFRGGTPCAVITADCRACKATNPEPRP